MSQLPAPLDRLVQQLSRLPGIGKRSAQRIAFYLARAPQSEIRGLADTLQELPDLLHPCATCGNLATEENCAICSDPRRDQTVLCVVEQPDNVAAIERTGAYRGVYHVLGGAISPLRSIGPEQLRIETLEDRLRSEQTSIEEVILATNPTVEGEATALFLARRLAELDLAVTRPATGLPVGGDLEYIDRSTLTRAFEGRRRLDR